MTFGDSIEVNEAAFVSPSASLSGSVRLGRDSSVWHNTTLRGDLACVQVGLRSNVQDGAVLHVARNLPCIVGDDVTIGHGAIVHGCRVGNRCLVGMGSIIMNGAEIGEGSIVAAGAIVTEGKAIPPRSLVVGSPARIVRQVTEEELNSISRSSSSYVELAMRARARAADPQSVSTPARSPGRSRISEGSPPPPLVPTIESLESLYPRSRLDAEETRYSLLQRRFESAFPAPGGQDNEAGAGPVWYSTPGRTELCGNHTDHNDGRVLAGAIDLDLVAVASARPDTIVRIRSEGFEPLELDLASLEPVAAEQGTSAALVRGMAAALRQAGAPATCGFDACVHSEVPAGSGLSSSAAFEVLIGTILADACGFSASPSLLAQCGKEAENRYFGKPSGLMDQMACAVGSVAAMDFGNPGNPEVRLHNLDLSRHGYSLAIVQTGGSHADLTAEYGSIPAEMRSVAAFFGRSNLRGISARDLQENARAIRTTCGDRAFLRAWHFAHEDERAAAAASALASDAFEEFLDIVRASGDSSWRFLQNLYPADSGVERLQELPLALALTERLLGKAGAARVHGGGFAGAIQVYLPSEALPEYRKAMDTVFGGNSAEESSTREIFIRPYGTVRLTGRLKSIVRRSIA